jgi:hypothetical protein
LITVDTAGMAETTGGAQESFQVWWDDRAGVVRCVWAADVVCSEQEARACTHAIEAVGRGGVPLLVDMRQMKKLERGAREHYKTNKGGVNAMALLVGSPVTRMLANFFMSTDVDRTPTRMFTDELSALTWLGEQ